VQVINVVFSHHRRLRGISDNVFYTYDLLIGYTMFALAGFFSFLGFMSILQMKLLFNDSFSQKVSHQTWTPVSGMQVWCDCM
jgi:hypothetical protein